VIAVVEKDLRDLRRDLLLDDGDLAEAGDVVVGGMDDESGGANPVEPAPPMPREEDELGQRRPCAARQAAVDAVK
jgi:hypothetical protein